MAFRAVRRIVQTLERILNPFAEILECHFDPKSRLAKALESSQIDETWRRRVHQAVDVLERKYHPLRPLAL